jgi:hypothetical protein
VSDEDGVATSNTVKAEDEENTDRRIGNRRKNKVQDRISGQLKKKLFVSRKFIRHLDNFAIILRAAFLPIFFYKKNYKAKL